MDVNYPENYMLVVRKQIFTQTLKAWMRMVIRARTSSTCRRNKGNWSPHDCTTPEIAGQQQLGWVANWLQSTKRHGDIVIIFFADFNRREHKTATFHPLRFFARCENEQSCRITSASRKRATFKMRMLLVDKYIREEMLYHSCSVCMIRVHSSS